MADAELTIVVRARDELTRQLQSLRGTIDGISRQLERGFGQGAEAVDKMGVELNDASAAAVRLGGGLATVDQRVDEVGNSARSSFGRFVSEGARAVGQMNLLERGLRGVRSTVGTIAGGFRSLGVAVRSALGPVLPFLTIAGAGFAAFSAVSDAKEFSRALSEVRSIVDESEVSIAELRAGVLDLSRTFGRSEVDQARGLYQAISSGAETAAEGLEILRVSTRLGIAGLADTEQTVDLVTSTLNAYRAQNLTAATAADVLFKTVELGKARVDELATSYGRVLPLGASLGVSFEELSGFLATLTLTFGSVEESVTALRGVLSGLLQISDEQRSELAALGAAVDPTSIATNGLARTLLDLGRALDNDTDRIRQFIPDVRGLTGALAILNDGGANLNRVLAQIQGSAGAVGRALDVQMADPARRLDLVINSLRLSFSQAFGGAFLRATNAAIDQLGGIDEAGRRIGDLGTIIGSALGGGLTVAIDLFSKAAASLSEFADRMGGVGNAAAFASTVVESFGRVVVGVVQLAIEEVRSLLNVIAFIPRNFEQVQAELAAIFAPPRIVGATAKEELAALNAALGQIEKNGIAAISILRETAGVGPSTLKDLSFQVEALLDQGSVDRAIREIQERRVSVRLEVQGEESNFTELRAALDRELDQAGARIVGRTQEINDAFSTLTAALRGDFGTVAREVDRLDARLTSALQAGLAAAAEPFVIRGMEEAEAQAASLEAQLAALGPFVQRGLDFGTVDADGLREFVAEAEGLQAQLTSARASAGQFREALAGIRERQLGEVERQIAGVDAALASAASAARALGVDGADAVRLLGDGLGATRERLEGLADGLREEIDELRGVQRIEVPVGLDFPELGDVVAPLRRALDAVLSPELGRERGRELAEGLSRELEGAFRDLPATAERQAGALEVQAQAGRDVLEQARELERLGLNLGTVTRQRLAVLERETAALDQQAGLIRDRAALEDSQIRRRALELEIDPTLDTNVLRQRIAEVEDLLERESLAVSLGVEVDDAQIAAALRELQTRAAVLARRRLEREAVFFGVDFRLPTEQLKLKLEEARAEAQAFADNLGARSAAREALTLGLSLDVDTINELEQEIALARDRAAEFAASRPVEATLLTDGIRGLSGAIGQIATDFERADEIARNFLTGLIQRTIEAAAQQAILQGAIAAVGGAQTGAGSFLAQTFGLAIPEGATAGVDALNVGAGQAGATITSAGTSAGTSLAAGGAAAAASITAAASAAAVTLAGSTGASFAGTLPGAFAQGAVVPYARGGVLPLARGGSPYAERIFDRPTLDESRRLRGTAVVPLSGGGVATPGGGRLSVGRGPGGALEVRGLALGGGAPTAPYALWGEAGREGVFTLRRTQDGRPGIAAEGGRVAPLTRVAGGRLGVDAHALGALVQPYQAGGALDTVRQPQRIARPVRQLARQLAAASPGGAVSVPVSVSVPLEVNVSGGGDDDPRVVAQGVREALARSREIREAIVGVVLREMEKRPSTRAGVRGNRV